MLAKDLVGTWKLASWTRKLSGTSKEVDAFGADPRGFLSYAVDGHMVVFIIRGDRSAPRESPPADQEKISLYDSLWAYAGTYAVEEGKVIHNLEITSNQSWNGIQQTRFCKLEGRRLVLTTPMLKDPGDGRESMHTITWDRVG